MDWTDRHCRVFWRGMTRHARLYTEMVTTGALLFGDAERHLRLEPDANTALQLGGSDASALAHCAEMGTRAGYAEINLNCGCPSDRVQEGRFGACLMNEPATVATAVRAMQSAVDIPVTVKHRIGVDDCEDYAFLRRFVSTVAEAGCTVFIVHARKAWLKGLSPKENREIPPLTYEYVYRLKQEFPTLTIVINGGIKSLGDCDTHLQQVDGVMLGREPYENPWLLAGVDAALLGAEPVCDTRLAALLAYRPYVERELAQGTPLAAMLRHTLGLFKGQPGGRVYRRVLSTQGYQKGADWRVVEAALDAMTHDASDRDAHPAAPPH